MKLAKYIIFFKYIINPVTPESFSISTWYLQTGNTYYDNILFLSNNGDYTHSIALNQGHWYYYGTPTLMLNNAYYSSTVPTPLNVWVYMTTVYNKTSSNV